MNDPVDTRFFRLLQQVLAATEAAGLEAARAAVDRAVQTEDPLARRAARAELDALAPALRNRVLAQVHARMAGDLSAIWAQMPHAPGSQKPN